MEIFAHLYLFVIIPLAGFVISIFVPHKAEWTMSRVALGTVGINFLLLLAYSIHWLSTGHVPVNEKDFVVYESENYEFFIDLCFDKINAVYSLVGGFLVSLVTVYSRYYLHREKGYKRFFNSILFFYLGYNVTILAGNLETLFIGWEILGISSFLLIAFYRDRYLPVKNAVKVFSIYRLGDVGIILAMWLSHHLWHENITFFKLTNYELVNEHLLNHSLTGVAISLMILVTAAAKSAQLPFSPWLARAMEGPTPSSAIFYGSLSVHLGVFLLLRTFPFWEHQLSVRILIGALGLMTSIVATGIARVQSSVKSQIAYSSIAQIGIIFFEIALGWLDLALIHFAGNAFLRTYQLLVSPSVVTYLIREQFYDFHKRGKTIEDYLPKKLAYGFYILSLKEFNLDSFMYRYFWNPLKWLGKKLDILSGKLAASLLILIFASGWILNSYQDRLSETLIHQLPIFFSLIGLVLVLKAFTERKNVLLAWLLVIFNHCWVALAISFNEHYDAIHNVLYLSGVLSFGIIGYFGLRLLRKAGNDIDLDRFHGFSHEHPVIAFVFLIACLGASGFPITPTFVGEDLIFSHIHEDQQALALFTSLSFVLDGIAIIRIYARVFMGPHVKSIYEMGYRSS
jgi:NADH:ubiquinone oxidoreductase subunit 5 (subunit L)/multisubunit Na+/H+ antiporter MnhA subunit